jgi:hypothetical protein
MNYNDISFIGWIHTLACVVAMITGAMELLSRKGTPAHAARGNTYFLSMVLANVTAMVIFHDQELFLRPGHPPVFHKGFGLIHWFAAFTLLLVLIGRLSALLRKRAFFAYAHPIFMILSYWFLMGGAVNELFVRVDWAKQAALAISPGAHNIAGYKLVYIIQFSLDAVWLAAIATAVVQIRRRMRAQCTLGGRGGYFSVGTEPPSSRGTGSSSSSAGTV